MTLTRLDRQLEFLKQIDRLKSVVRQSPLIDRSRRENTAEHSWHLGMYAMVLAEYADGDVDTSRVVKMLLVHDIVEIDAGDTPIHNHGGPSDQSEREHRAALRLFGLLPPDQALEFRLLWEEFEAAESADARFAKSLDRLQPLIHNVATGGGTWLEAGVSEIQVEQRYGPIIEGGAVQLWNHARECVQQHFKATASQG
jgi:putative hydrolase of HD superfamily